MTTRVLGTRGADTTGGLVTSSIGLGCMGFSQGYGATDDAESAVTMRAAVDAGVTMFDTAMSYGAGHNERLVGDVLAAFGGRGRIRVASKFGIVRGPDGVVLDGNPDRVQQYCQQSLQRLGIDHIDLYYLHRVDPRYPIEETVGAMGRLVESGAVGHIGVSEVTAEQLEAAHRTHPITALQLEWSLMWREPEIDLIPTARRLGIGIVPYSPLGRGLLTDTLKDTESVAASPFRSNDPRFRAFNLTNNQRQVSRLAALAGAWGMTTAQLALAWLLSRGPDIVPIPGSRYPDRARENAAAMSVTLDDAQFAELAATVPEDGWAGDRASFAVPTTRRPGRSGQPSIVTVPAGSA